MPYQLVMCIMIRIKATSRKADKYMDNHTRNGSQPSYEKNTNPIKQPIYKRQQFLLALAQQLEGKTTSTDFQKIVFMYLMKSGLGYYDFVPYKYGAYSFQLAQDVDVLCKDRYMTTDNMLAEPEDYTPVIALNFSAIEKARSYALIRKAYEQYPYYAIRSEIADKILNSEALRAVEAVNQQLVQNNQKLFPNWVLRGKSVSFWKQQKIIKPFSQNIKTHYLQKVIR